MMLGMLTKRPSLSTGNSPSNSTERKGRESKIDEVEIIMDTTQLKQRQMIT